MTWRWTRSGERGFLPQGPGKMASGSDKRSQSRWPWKQGFWKSGERSCNKSDYGTEQQTECLEEADETGKRNLIFWGTWWRGSCLEHSCPSRTGALTCIVSIWSRSLGEWLAGKPMSVLPSGRWKRCFVNVQLPSIPLILGTISLLFIWQKNPQCISLEASEFRPSAKWGHGPLFCICWRLGKYGKMCSNLTIWIDLWNRHVFWALTQNDC